MVFFTCTSEQHIYEIGDTVLSKRSHHILTWPLTQYSETELGLYEVLHHRAKSCKWLFPESIFSFKGGVCKACELRALGLLLADGAPTVGRGKTF